VKLYDITGTLKNGMPVWPGDVPFEAVTTGCESQYRITRLVLSAHTGTHVDAPAHFIDGGDGADKLPLGILIGPARVLNISDAGCIDRAMLEALPLMGVERLLFSTRNAASGCEAPLASDDVYITAEAAHYLVGCGVKLVAIDYLSVDPAASSTYPAHHLLLEAGVVILEGVDLRAVPAGDYELLCLPLKIQGGDGAPARAVLREV
jgi:arylformamidase